MKIFEEDFEPPIMCSYIDNICPFGDLHCDDCRICIAIEEVKELSLEMQKPEQEKYDEYHADDYKRDLEDRLLMGE